MRHIILFSSLLLASASFLFTSCTKTKVKTYTNPLSDSISIGDPFMLLHEGKYYLYGTTSSNSGFKAWSSSNMTDWQEEGFVYAKTDSSWGKKNFWAPEVTKYNNEFYLAYSCQPKDTSIKYMLLGLARSKSPTGPFTDVYAPWFDMGFGCIDAHLFFDTDGKIYLYFDKVGVVGTWPDRYMYGKIYVTELDKGLKPIGDTVFCSTAEQEWENPLSNHSRCNEGSFVFKNNDTYYMTFSANHYNDPFYGIGYSTAKSPFGPWIKSPNNPLVSMDTTRNIWGPGHNCFVKSPDGNEMFMVYHTHISGTNKNRNVNIDRIEFNDKGELIINGPSRTPQLLPSGIE